MVRKGEIRREERKGRREGWRERENGRSECGRVM